MMSLTLSGRAARLAAAGFSSGLLLIGASGAARGQANNACDQRGEAPDLIIGQVGNEEFDPGVRRFGATQGITAFAIGGTACNIGTCAERWISSDNHHPVIGQNLFRLKDGRFEQIGQAWVKHTYFALSDAYCGGTCLPTDGDMLGVNCSDLYGSGDNGFQGRMGTKVEVNPYTGVFSYPPSNNSPVTSVLSRRLQVHDVDLDPASNRGARYIGEIQYVAPDDASAGHGGNNVSYRPATLSVGIGGFDFAMTGTTTVGSPGILAWRAIDPSVTVTTGGFAGDGSFFVAMKTTWLGNGTWRYEYAVQNLNSNHAPIALSIPIPPGTHVSNAQFHDVDYHSGDSQEGRNWTRTIGASSIQWVANRLVLDGQIMNVLRWGTLYNFRFDADAAPGTRSATFGFSEFGSPYTLSLSIAVLAPSACDSDAVCDPGETCAGCPADCEGQGGGSGCCGDGACEPGESAAACFADCGTALAAESACGDGVDGDRDGLLDCFDPDCCADTACDAFDVDGDGRGPDCDCDDKVGGSWGTPGEVAVLSATEDDGSFTLEWTLPQPPGGSALLYDVLRSTDPADFTDASCLEVPLPASRSAVDDETPPPGSAYFYLVRARSACVNGVGPLGAGSNGVPHTAPPCPG